ncbi:hypothetical protein IEI94_08980 [Halomonas sp. ML-15]|uniref:hypothetical protein n=1 Tax=unclassified Halomonas TaxID=2609666 RepID=UPI0003ED77B2|nr:MULTISPECIES: hypothetical protein [unclassified Halomonas]EWH02000.1 hypothetical protein Q427_11075 [Halomonas sp. BC04]MBD3895982.1 hypothetical protein [Halomonas sp. ML-15]
MSNFRTERIGLTNAARLLGVSVNELKAAIHQGTPLRGVTPPQPVVRAGGNRGNLLFLAGDVMDCAETMSKAGRGA